MTMTSGRDSILTAVRHAAEDNHNRPPGERSFYAQSRLNRTALQRAGFPNYGAAVEAAGYSRNKLQQAYPDDQLFLPLAELTRRLGHFPTTNELRVQRYSDTAFPSYEAYSRRAKHGSLDQALLSWCRARESFQDVVQLLKLRS